MSDLTKQAKALGLLYESSASGTWIRFPCPHGGMRYVIQNSLTDGYLSWCETSNPARPDWPHARSMGPSGDRCSA